MDFASQLILFTALLFLISILASAWSPRLGVPLLLVFLIVGMLAGEDGLGGIHYDDVESAYLIGTLALAVILFDGGLRTDVATFRVALRPAIVLATAGVVVTAAICGLGAVWILDLSWIEGLLIGAIVGSTDAAAVFSLLHARGLTLKSRVAATLEIESGINDPMAIFLTIALVELLASGEASSGWLLPVLFVWQLGMGAAIGIIGGRILAYGVARLVLNPGLYPLLALFGGLFIYGLAAVLNASGFLAVYLAGLVVGNRVTRGLHNIQRFHDGMAWLAQISLFLILGLLVTPSELLPYAGGALLIALALMFVARPLAIWLCLSPFRFNWREQSFIAWVGLRGAVPIVLAMFPWAAGLEQWHDYFNITFFIVLVSLLLQGWTVAPAARLLKLEVPSSSARVQRVELGIPGQEDYEIVGYKLAADSPALDVSAEELRLPGDCKLFCMLRGAKPLEPAEAGALRVHDQVYLLARPGVLAALDKLLVGEREPERLGEQAFFGEFVINPRARLAELGALYGFDVPPEHADWSIARHIHNKFPRPVVGDRVRLGQVEFVVREMQGSRVTKVGLKLPH